MSVPKVRVLIADDDEALAAALADTVGSADDLEVVGIRHDTEAVVNAAAVCKPDVVLMDVRMPGGGGVVATKRVLAQHADIAVVGLSAYEDRGTASAMLEAGAVAYIVKGSPEHEIVEAIRRAQRGQMSMPSELGVGTFRDLITKLRDRTDSEASLRASEERVHALLDAMPDSLLIVSSRGDIEVANASTQRMFGYSPGELIGQPVEVLIPERFRPSHSDHLQGFVEHPRNRMMGKGLSLFGRRKDGSEFPVAISLSPLRRKNDSAVVAAVRDITEIEDADEVRRKSEQLFRGLLESAPDAMVVVDERGRIQVVNTRTEQLFGYPRQELIGQSVDELVPRALRPGHGGHRAKYFSDPQIRPMGQGLELFGRRRDGTEFPVDISLSPMPTDDGLLVIGAVRDISDRKTAEKRLAQTQETAERRKLMAHLVQAQEEERRKIAADIHDDSIQAMTAASLRLQQLRKHMTTEKQQELVARLDEAVRESITRLRRLMFDLRPPTLDRTGLGPALRELLERVRAEIDIEYTLEDRLATEPSGDVRIELYRICQEALANVRKHAKAAHVKVELQRVDNGYHVRVADDGAGFDIPTRSGQPGHLGLIAMRERATIAGGWWTIDSKPSQGAVVDFWLPDDRDAGNGAVVEADANGGPPKQGSLEAPH
jgi:PAS domain S-box-containing protein